MNADYEMKKTVLPVLFLCLAFCFIAPAFGRETVGGEGKKDGFRASLERGRQSIDARVQSLTKRLDSVFASEDSVELASDSTLSAGLVGVLSEGGDLRLETLFNLKLSMPRTRDRLELFFDNISDDVLPGSDRVTEDDNPLQLGLRHYLLKNSRRLLRMEAGLSWQGGPELFLRLRLFSFVWDLKEWTARFSQALFWKTYRREGFGISGKADFDRFLHENLLFRHTTGTHWSETTRGMEWEESVMLRWDLVPERCSLLGRTSVFFYDFRGVSNVRADVTWRRRVFVDWFFVSVTPRADFPEESDYDFTPSLRIGTEAVF